MRSRETLRARPNEHRGRDRGKSTPTCLTAQISRSFFFPHPVRIARTDLTTETAQKELLTQAAGSEWYAHYGKKVSLCSTVPPQRNTAFSSVLSSSGTPCPQSKIFHRPAHRPGRMRFPHDQQDDFFVELPGKTCAGSFGEQLTLEGASAETRAYDKDGEARGSAVVIVARRHHGGRVAAEARGTCRGPFTAWIIGLCFCVRRGY
jgi:hypothetical protein